jgi:gamma-glutamyl phosphate reductase
MTTSFQPLILDIAQRAKRASFTVSNLTTELKNQVLRSMAHRLVQESARIEAENAKGE